MAEKKKYPWNKSILNLFRKRNNRDENVSGVYAGPPPRDEELALAVYAGPPDDPDLGQELPAFSEQEPVIDVYNGPPVDLWEEPEEPEADSRTGNSESMVKCTGCGHEYPAASLFCPECGTPNPEKR